MTAKPILSFPLRQRGGRSIGYHEDTQADGNNEAGLSLNDLTRNLLVLGGTGSGKTRSVFLPATRSLLEQDCAGLVLDIKGDYLSYLSSATAKSKLTVIGASEHCDPINLIQGMSDEGLRQLLEAEVNAYRSTDRQWGLGGIRDALLVAHALKDCLNTEPSLALIYDHLVQPNRFCEELWAAIHRRSQLPETLAHYLRQAIADRFSILWMGGYRGLGPTDLIKADFQQTQAQYTWQTSVLIGVLRPFATNLELRAKLSAENTQAPDIADLVYRQGKIIVLDLPYSVFAQSAYTCARILRQRFAEAVFSVPTEVRKAYQDTIAPCTFLLIDEYQHFLSATAGAAATGAIDDNLFLDKSREYGHVNLLGTQGLSSLFAQAPREAVYAILQNCRNKVLLSTSDEATVHHFCQPTISDAQAEDLSRPKGRNWAYLISDINEASKGASIQADILLGQSEALPHMAHFVEHPFAPAAKNYHWANRQLAQNPLLEAPQSEAVSDAPAGPVLITEALTVHVLSNVEDFDHNASMLAPGLRNLLSEARYSIENHLDWFSDYGSKSAPTLVDSLECLKEELEGRFGNEEELVLEEAAHVVLMLPAPVAKSLNSDPRSLAMLELIEDINEDTVHVHLLGQDITAEDVPERARGWFRTDLTDLVLTVAALHQDPTTSYASADFAESERATLQERINRQYLVERHNHLTCIRALNRANRENDQLQVELKLAHLVANAVQSEGSAFSREKSPAV
ncbi:helicase HerA domain-containing protein [Ferrimonas marina]|uniref:AAA-like domain-containing protein n=1 Tax=Ferrimonas marina TaxID=299255 RepID=A0A1M5T950_9GAMM|nr:type IV secretory system conjugative DNA transfer family protein [Ferrimonas marina]SHH47228.1 AAA-like domain-containing protein [Ferrimonas marina]